MAYFALLDLTGDGLITTREMARAERSSLVALQMPPAVHMAVVGKFLALDANRDGLITRHEFVNALGPTMAQQVVGQQVACVCVCVTPKPRTGGRRC